jgi:type 1 glutamine amidotransferase
MRELRLFLVSFVVLFLEVALIRWLPAYIRLLSYFSNFILLASFLGIGIGCLLASRRSNLFGWFPLLQLALVGAADRLRLEIAVPSTTSIYFSSGTTQPVVPVESTRLLPLLFIAIAALFVMVAQRLGRELGTAPPLRAYAINLAGSLAGVGAFALVSWLQLPPSAWFAIAFAAALPFVLEARRPVAIVNLVLIVASLAIVHVMERGSLWSPYYRITMHQDRTDTVVEVNNIFHQSMAPVDQKEYFYQWPYTVFGDTFENVLILGAGTGTDVAAALRHGAKHVDAVEIDPVILALGAAHHPDHPYDDPRVTQICDDARHFLRTTTKKYDLVVFALIDSLTLQSSFSSVRLESYMFTEESFQAVRDRLTPRGVMAVYNYFREKWLVDRLANTLTLAFGEPPRAFVHEDRAYLAVMLAGPRLHELPEVPTPPSRFFAYGQPQAPSPARELTPDTSVVPATDDWPFLYMRAPGLPRHYLAALGIILAISTLAVFAAVKTADPFSPQRGKGVRPLFFFFLGAGFMLLETKSIVQFALLWGSTWSSASLAIASVLVMALASTLVAARFELRSPWPIAAALFALLAVNYFVPIGRLAFPSRAAESLVYGLLVFSPVFCAGLLFSAGFKRSPSAAVDFGANLLGAMIGGVCEYLSLVEGYHFLLIMVALFYMAAVIAVRLKPRATGGGARLQPSALLLLFFTACGASTVVTPSGNTTPPAAHLLYVTQSAGFKHDVLPLSAQVLLNIGRQSGVFDVTASDESTLVTRDSLARFDAVAFFTSGELPMSADQKAALLDFVRSGRGFIGIHSATDTFYEWPEYGAMIGAYFDGHPWHQQVTIRNDDASHPSTAALPATFQLADEIYQFRNWSRADVHGLLSLDPRSVDTTVDGVHRADRDFALSWTRAFGQGRVFYTALGHEAAVWNDGRFQQHLAGGIRWAMGRL